MFDNNNNKQKNINQKQSFMKTINVKRTVLSSDPDNFTITYKYLMFYSHQLTTTVKNIQNEETTVTI